MIRYGNMERCLKINLLIGNYIVKLLNAVCHMKYVIFMKLESQLFSKQID